MLIEHSLCVWYPRANTYIDRNKGEMTLRECRLLINSPHKHRSHRIFCLQLDEWWCHLLMRKIIGIGQGEVLGDSRVQFLSYKVGVIPNNIQMEMSSKH